jgi:hypothetical protein
MVRWIGCTENNGALYAVGVALVGAKIVKVILPVFSFKFAAQIPTLLDKSH